MNKIDPTAKIAKSAELGDNNTIGAFCLIGENVKLGNNNVLLSNVIIEGDTTIGDSNKFYHGAIIGSNPQDLKFQGEPTKLLIGSHNTIREFATINKSATMDEPTQIGDNCLLMAYSHVAHNCILGNNLIIANSVQLAGHIHIHDFVTIGGMTAVHQFVKLGKYAFVGGKSGVKKDVPPYTRGEGFPYKVMGLNSVGLQRKGFSREQITEIKNIYRLFYGSGKNVSQAMAVAEKMQLSPEQKIFLDFIKISERGLNR